jgi:rhamnosyltransferase subunit B
MSRIVIAVFGSLGDLHPKIALGLELKRRGHQVIFATIRQYQERLESLGFEYQRLRPDDISPDDPATIALMMDLKQGTERLLKDYIFANLRQTYSDLLAIAQEADLLVVSEIVFAGSMVAEKLGIPWVLCSLAPISFFSAYDPPVFPPYPWLRHLRSWGQPVNRLIIQFAALTTYPWSAPARQLRQELGLAPRANPVMADKFSPYLNLAMFSPLLGQPQPDWPAHTVQTGATFYDSDNIQIDSVIEEFLQVGPPPIVFTLGSAAVYAPGDFYTQSVTALEQLGQRGILLIGEQQPPPSQLPSSIAAFAYGPFSQLFPRSCAIVHQGGVGTTAQALRSGRPTLVVPYSHDQPDNGDRVERLGTARTLPRQKYRAELVAENLRALLSDPAYTTRAAAMGAQISQEQGEKCASDEIEKLLVTPP